MKALLINGSPRPNGCTFTALTELANTLEAEGIETVRNDPVFGDHGRLYGHAEHPRSQKSRTSMELIFQEVLLF